MSWRKRGENIINTWGEFGFMISYTRQRDGFFVITHKQPATLVSFLLLYQIFCRYWNVALCYYGNSGDEFFCVYVFDRWLPEGEDGSLTLNGIVMNLDNNVLSKDKNAMGAEKSNTLTRKYLVLFQYCKLLISLQKNTQLHTGLLFLSNLVRKLTT